MLGFLSGRAPEQNYSDEPIATKLQALTGPGRILKVFFFLLACVFACIAVIIGIMAIAEIVSNGAGAGNWEELVIAPALTTLTFFAFAIVFYIAALIFRDVSNGESPFTMKQARRIKVIAWLLFAYAVLDSLAPKGMAVSDNFAERTLFVVRFEPGYTVINIGMFASAIIFYFLSSVFKYGVSLQEDSDDII